MGKDLHASIVEFFEARMREHSEVESFRRLKNDEEIIYEITRRRFKDKVRVWLSDHYNFEDADFYNRPREIQSGDYILIAKPEGSPTISKYENECIGIGKIKIFMGALNKQKMWEYELPAEVGAQKRSG